MFYFVIVYTTMIIVGTSLCERDVESYANDVSKMCANYLLATVAAAAARAFIGAHTNCDFYSCRPTLRHGPAFRPMHPIPAARKSLSAPPTPRPLNARAPTSYRFGPNWLYALVCSLFSRHSRPNSIIHTK